MGVGIRQTWEWEWEGIGTDCMGMEGNGKLKIHSGHLSIVAACG